jgi:hypothetical protein
VIDPFLHLDIDTDGIHAILFEGTFSNKKIVDQYRLHYDDMPETKQEENLFQKGMERIATKMELTSSLFAVIFVSPMDVCFRNISLPFTNKKKIRQILPLELSPRLPLPEEQWISDFILQDLNFTPDQQLLLTASILKSEVEKLVSGLKPFKINPLVITPKGYAAALCFLKQRREISDFLFVHMDKRVITLTLVADRKPVLLRSFARADQTPEQIGQIALQTITGFRQRSESDKIFDLFIATKDPSQYRQENLAALEKVLSKESDARPPTIETLDSENLLSSISPSSQPEKLFNFCRGEFGAEPFFKKQKQA